MTAEARIVPSRVPGPARVAVFVVLLATVSWALGAFSAWPWTASPPGRAVLRVSFRHVTGFSGAVAARSAEEIAKLPVHMRPRDPSRPATGRRADATLTITLDGRTVFERRYRPTGLRRDGPVFGYAEVPVAPGRHAVAVALADAGVTAAAGASLAREIDFEEGRAPLLEFREGSGWEAQ